MTVRSAAYDIDDIFLGLSVHDEATGTTFVAKSFATDPTGNCVDGLGNAAHSEYIFSSGYFTAPSSSTNVGWSFYSASHPTTEVSMIDIVYVDHAMVQMI